MLQSLAIIHETHGQKNPFAYQVGFQQNLNSYYWLSQIHYNRVIFGTGLFELQENFNSSLIRLSGDDHKWKDDQQLNVKLFIPHIIAFLLILNISSKYCFFGFLSHPIPFA